MDSPTRSASARAMRKSRPSSWRDFFNMKTPALAKAAMMPTRAKAIRIFMGALSHPMCGAGLTRFIVLLAALAAAAGTARLGFWQLERARQKDSVEAAVQARASLPALSGSELQGPQDIHRLVEVEGRWQAKSLIFLENRPMAGMVGFVALTVLELSDGRSVLVQRGWQPRDLRDRTLTLPVPTPEHAVRLRARVAPPPSRLLEFQEGDTGMVRQNVDLQRLAEEFAAALIPQVSLVQLEPARVCLHSTAGECAEPVEDGLRREWAVIGSSADKNRGYALQWFSLSVLVTGLYLWFQWIAPWRRRRHGSGHQDPA